MHKIETPNTAALGTGKKRNDSKGSHILSRKSYLGLGGGIVGEVVSGARRGSFGGEQLWWFTELGITVTI